MHQWRESGDVGGEGWVRDWWGWWFRIGLGRAGQGGKARIHVGHLSKHQWVSDSRSKIFHRATLGCSLSLSWILSFVCFFFKIFFSNFCFLFTQPHNHLPTPKKRPVVTGNGLKTKNRTVRRSHYPSLFIYLFFFFKKRKIRLTNN